LRAYLEDRVLILYNRSDKPKEFNLSADPELSNGQLSDQLGNLEKVEVKNGKLSLLLPALTSAVLIPK
jgi:hypothetical protein